LHTLEVAERVAKQSLEEDLKLIDLLEGRDEIPYGATPLTVKAVALELLDREWTYPESLRLRP